jgi:nucleoid DNA-binding protein
MMHELMDCMRPTIPMVVVPPDAGQIASIPFRDDHPLLLELRAALPDLDSATIKAVLEALPVAVAKAIESSSEVELPRLLSFAVRRLPGTEPRAGINPFTKQPMPIPGQPPCFTVRIASLFHERFRELKDEDVLDDVATLRQRGTRAEP